MINDPLTLDKALEILNSMVEADPDAITALLEKRVPCNKALAHHPTVQMLGEYDIEGDVVGGQVGLMGILNGLFGVGADGWGALVSCYNVVCPTCGVNESNKVDGDPCPICGKILQLSAVTKFQRYVATQRKEE